MLADVVSNMPAVRVEDCGARPLAQTHPFATAIDASMTMLFFIVFHILFGGHESSFFQSVIKSYFLIDNS